MRGHAAAQLNTNDSVDRGAATVDPNTIPTAALDRTKVLRDGASAQYGSDAIAGVINPRLREAREGGGASDTYGFCNTGVETARTRRSVNGDSTATVSAWQGIGLGTEGFLTLTSERVKGTRPITPISIRG